MSPHGLDKPGPCPTIKTMTARTDTVLPLCRRLLAALAVLLGIGVAAPRWHQVPCAYRVGCAVLANDTLGWASATVGSYLTGFLRYDGRDWILTDTIRNQLIYDFAFAGSSAWAVGEQFNFPDGVVYRHEGTWQQQADPFDRTLQGVSFPCETLGFAGGASPVQHHPVMIFENGTWRIDTTLTTRRVVLDLYATYPGKCIAVGDSGAIFCWREGTWEEMRSPTTQHLRSLDMESNTEGWAAGERGTILRCFKDTWAVAPSPTTRRLYSLSMAGTSDEAWAVGDSGTILHMERDSWKLDPFTTTPPYVPLFTVSFSSAGNGWAFGYTPAGAAVALHYYDDSTGAAEPGAAPAPDRRPGCFPNPLPAGRPLHIQVEPGTAVEVSDVAGRVVYRQVSATGVVVWPAEVSAGCYLVKAGPLARPVRVVKPRRPGLLQ